MSKAWKILSAIDVGFITFPHLCHNRGRPLLLGPWVFIFPREGTESSPRFALVMHLWDRGRTSRRCYRRISFSFILCVCVVCVKLISVTIPSAWLRKLSVNYPKTYINNNTSLQLPPTPPPRSGSPPYLAAELHFRPAIDNVVDIESVLRKSTRHSRVSFLYYITFISPISPRLRK